MSRFLAKMALEVLYQSLGPDLYDYVVDSEHYDRIRDWARRGDNYYDWPIYKRRIFPQETLMRHPNDGAWVRVGFGYDLLITTVPETYFAFCIYGIEYVINVGGPAIKGYQQWLNENGGRSPLIEQRGMHLRVLNHEGNVQYFLEHD